MAVDLEQRVARLAQRIESLEDAGGSSDHGNSAHTPNFLAEAGYDRGQLLVAAASGLLSPLDVGAARGYLRSDGLDPLYTTTMPVNIGPSATLTIASGLVTATRTQHDLSTEGGAPSDTLLGVLGGTPGDILLLQLTGADTVELKHLDFGTPAGARLLLWGDKNAELVVATDRIVFVNFSGGWLEMHRTIKAWPKLEAPWGPQRITLSKPLPAATNNASLDDDWVYKSPWTNEAVRISRWYVRFESNLAAAATFELRKNGTLITGASITVALGARDAAVDSFTETTLADGDSLEIWQTAGNAEDIGGSAYVYGDQDVVVAVTY